MSRFLILTPEHTNSNAKGKGALGRNLYSFLKSYYGSSSVSLISRQHLISKNSYSTDYLFIGIPSLITRKELNYIKFNQAHLFDYQDDQETYRQNSDQDLLLSITNSYLKSWTESSWDSNIQWGQLPIRRHLRLPLLLYCNKLYNNTLYTNHNRHYDTCFYGNINIGWLHEYHGNLYNPRILWLQQILNSPNHSFHGGLINKSKSSQHQSPTFDEIPKSLYLHTRINFVSYFNSMINARTVLAPPGNARWSYRHYEAIYAGAIPITSDFHNTNMLIPLPNEGLAHVGNNESVILALDYALRLRRDNRSIIYNNLNHLEQYLTNGIYNKNNHKLIKRFIHQLDKPSVYSINSPF